MLSYIFICIHLRMCPLICQKQFGCFDYTYAIKCKLHVQQEICSKINKTLRLYCFKRCLSTLFSYFFYFAGSTVRDRDSSCCLRSSGWYRPKIVGLTHITGGCRYASASFRWDEPSLESFEVKKYRNQVRKLIILIENDFIHFVHFNQVWISFVCVCMNIWCSPHKTTTILLHVCNLAIFIKWIFSVVHPYR